MISGDFGFYTVSGSHVYSDAGDYNIDVVVTDDDPGPGQVIVGPKIQDIANPHVRMFGSNLVATAGQPLNSGNILMTLQSDDPNVSLGSLTAKINWGDYRENYTSYHVDQNYYYHNFTSIRSSDGYNYYQPDYTTQTTGSIGYNGSRYQVTGEHTYSRAGVYKATVTLTGGGINTSSTISILVTEQALIGLPSYVELTSPYYYRYPIAQFVDPNNDVDKWQRDEFGKPYLPKDEYRAEVVLGDGRVLPAGIGLTPGARVITI